MSSLRRRKCLALLPGLSHRCVSGLRAAGSEGETTLRSDGKRSSPYEEAHKDLEIISVDSPNLASDDQPVLEGAPNKAGCTSGRGDPS